MNVWCHLPTIFGHGLKPWTRRRVLHFAGLVALSAALITTLLFASISNALAGTTTNRTINFQGRLLTPEGTAVPDGHYNIQFRIYEGGTGTVAGNPGGSLKWTETYLNNGGKSGVEVKNGFLSVELGSVIPFGTTVNWDAEVLWLSMNVAGSSNCAGFGNSGCPADGEMLPMKRMTATPYAINAGAVGGKTADNFVQLAQGVQTDATTNTSSIHINKTGSGNFVKFEKDGEGVLTVKDSGDLTFGGGSDKLISVAAAPADTTGRNLTITAGAGGEGEGANGGHLALQGGSAGGVDGNGGNVVISGGSGNGAGANGLVVLTTPTFSTVTDDVNCYANGALVPTSCEITGSSVNNSAAILVGFSTSDQTATLPDPTLDTPGRILYVMAAQDSEAFTLSFNGGGAGNEVTLRERTSIALIWNGSDWTTTGGGALATGSTAEGGNTNVQVGNGVDDGEPTLLTVDKSATAPLITDEALVGSMYYDTTLGKLQCYEATGWGACGSTPDSFISLSPEYAGAVVNGSSLGTLTSDICSDSLNLNDGSDSQPTVCGTNETSNFYDWTSNELAAQTRSLYVTYQLPNNFKEFIANSTSLNARTDSINANVTYQLYKNNGNEGLVACGSSISASAGPKSTWQQAKASGESDPADCDFKPGDSIVIRINMTASNNAHAYVGNLNFAYSIN